MFITDEFWFEFLRFNINFYDTQCQSIGHRNLPDGESGLVGDLCRFSRFNIIIVVLSKINIPFPNLLGILENKTILKISLSVDNKNSTYLLFLIKFNW